MAPKMDQKPLKITSQIDLDFEQIFQCLFDRFLKNLVPMEPQKTFKMILILKVFHFSDILFDLFYSLFFDCFFFAFFAVHTKMYMYVVQNVCFV